MNIKTLKIIKGVLFIGGFVFSLASTILTHKIDKTEQLEAIAKLVAEQKK